MKIGYARVSTREQNLDAQILELTEFGCTKIFVEKASGANLERVVLKELFEFARPKDELYLIRVDRFSRSLKDLVFLMDECVKREFKMFFDGKLYDFSTAEGRFLGSLFGLMAQYERDLIKARTVAGIKAKRESGFEFGRPKGLSKEAQLKAKQAYSLRSLGTSIAEIRKGLNIKSLRTVYSYLRFEAERLAKETGRELAENGIDLK